jgi:hypothetical protein
MSFGNGKLKDIFYFLIKDHGVRILSKGIGRYFFWRYI